MARIAALCALSAVSAAVVARSDGRVIPGPASQADQPSWLAAQYAFKAQQRASVNYSSANYDNYIPWSSYVFIAPQSHMYDRFLFDNVAGVWTVDRFLDDFVARYGGVDGVLLWPTYPNMGVDERSQFDIFGDVPGGLPALKAAVAQFNARGVKVS